MNPDTVATVAGAAARAADTMVTLQMLTLGGVGALAFLVKRLIAEFDQLKVTVQGNSVMLGGHGARLNALERAGGED